MFPFDLPLEVSLSVFVVIIFSLYALIIMKFAPSETTPRVDERSRSTDKPVVRSDVPPTHAVNPASKKAKDIEQASKKVESLQILVKAKKFEQIRNELGAVDDLF